MWRHGRLREACVASLQNQDLVVGTTVPLWMTPAGEATRELVPDASGLVKTPTESGRDG